MRPRFFLAAALLLYAAPAADAHRLDEYLQAAMLSVEKDHVAVNIRLTPGVAVFGKVMAAIGAGENGLVSSGEQRAYAEKVGRDLALSLDGSRVPLRLRSYSFPDIDEMKQGTGEIVLDFEGQTPRGGPIRRLVFENGHLSAISVYLANCLVPDDPKIRITAQNRNYLQSVYQVDYVQDDGRASDSPAPTEPATTSWLARTGGTSLFNAYFYQGVRHILTGYDHLLFVTALVLAATTLWDLIKVVGTFTLAHTLTLTLAATNVVSVPESVGEPLIAGSIVFVALQNVLWPRQARGWGRLGAAFFFGLFHGLGFAGGLLEAMREMPGGTLMLAIVAFSLGVEAGHQLVVLPLFAMLKAVRRVRKDAAQRARLSLAIQRVGSAGVALAGMYYLCLQFVG